MGAEAPEALIVGDVELVVMARRVTGVDCRPVEMDVCPLVDAEVASALIPELAREDGMAEETALHVLAIVWCRRTLC